MLKSKQKQHNQLTKNVSEQVNNKNKKNIQKMSKLDYVWPFYCQNNGIIFEKCKNDYDVSSDS